jgi:hypothetical protein
MPNKVLRFNPNSSKDRRDFFKVACDLLALVPEDVAKTLKIGSTAAGFTVNLDHVIEFVKKYKIQISMSYVNDPSAAVLCPMVESTGNAAVENPDSIKPTSVDGNSLQSFESVEGKK